MKRVQQILHFLGIVGALVVMTGCTYVAAMRQLPPQERTALRAYSKVMSAGQVQTYLAKQTAAERTSYLEKIGVVQRFQALAPQDREAVLAGYIRTGMRADALRFLWGEPHYTSGYPGRYEYWFYLGSTLTLADYGSSGSIAGGTKVQVSLVNGRVEWWLEYVEPHDESGPNDRSGRTGKGD
jgi:hypothetical protein